MITRLAPAKLNLALEVLGRRPDGYHEIVSVVQTIDLADTLEFAPSSDLTLTCSDASLVNEDNLGWRAARGLQAATRTRAGAAIHLEKRIPLAAGLGGGSSDAAATFLGLSELWGVSMPAMDLYTLARLLGADVPFFLRGGTALVEGTGERVTTLPPLKPHWAVLLVPPLSIPRKTATLYGRLRPAHCTDGTRTRALAQAIRTNASLDPCLLVNAFQPVLTEPEMARGRAAMLEAGAPWAALSGSGPPPFCFF
ncbi:MAG: 4-(cytidine 5'-diphospho)-2-C-methyl-D-erythritol kinase, partial [Bacteroidetes bacterium]|nr:4-(cytidine 5'-diphospho)-2-C-methyl-D-erythritol kinase [Bacteroidota bacterium]